MDDHVKADTRLPDRDAVLRTGGPAHPVPQRHAGGLRPQSVARLLGIAFDVPQADECDSDEMLAELLGAHLAGTWVPPDGRGQAWSRLVRQLWRKKGSNGERTVGELLLDPQAELATIREIRNRAKEKAAKENLEAEHAVMTTLYFAAIAHALVFRGVKITTHSYESLVSSFERLERKAWMPADFVALFERAARVCREK